VVAVGYDMRPAKPFIWVRNSWGSSWGTKPPGSKEAGYFKMDTTYFTDPSKVADDLWIIKKN
jgi:C1A family cysteine protease